MRSVPLRIAASLLARLAIAVEPVTAEEAVAVVAVDAVVGDVMVEGDVAVVDVVAGTGDVTFVDVVAGAGDVAVVDVAVVAVVTAGETGGGESGDDICCAPSGEWCECWYECWCWCWV